MEKNEAIDTLYRAKEKLENVSDKDSTLDILREAGKAVGYKPAFRCLIAGATPEDAIKWK